MSVPTPFPDIDYLLAYILQSWNENNNQAITGTIGQNVVWNSAELLKKNPENWNRASVVTALNINYTTQPSECIIIFTNNSHGNIDFGNNIWNKWYIVNQTNNIRSIAGGKFYYDINGTAKTSIPARKTLYIAKGNDDFWYEIVAVTSGLNPSVSPLTGIVGNGGGDDPVTGLSTFQNNKLIGLGASNDGKITIQLDGQNMVNFGNNSSFVFDNTTGEIDISPATWFARSSLWIDLNQ